MTSRSATVALSGEGTDELFGGYLTYRANDLARTARRFPSALLRWGASAARGLPVSDEKIGFEYKAEAFRGRLPDAAGAGARVLEWHFFRRRKAPTLRTALPGELNSVLSELSRAGDRSGAYLWFDQKYYLPDDILAKVDRMSMAHSIEVRPPFLDHRIVEFAARLPDGLKIRGAEQKVMLRRLMRNRLPPSVLRRKKVGFDIPAHEWLRGPAAPAAAGNARGRAR